MEFLESPLKKTGLEDAGSIDHQNYQCTDIFCTFKPMNRVLKITVTAFTILSIWLTASCKNSIEEVKALSYKDTFPLESARDVEMIFSDSAKIQALLKSPLVNRYGGDNPYIILPEGMNVYFFDENKKVKTSLKAGYAIKYDKSEVMEARQNVVVVNHLGEKLKTEHLVWDQNKRIIYTEQEVTILRKNELIKGRGMRADESFDKWIILKPMGTFYINTGEDSTSGPMQP